MTKISIKIYQGLKNSQLDWTNHLCQDMWFFNLLKWLFQMAMIVKTTIWCDIVYLTKNKHIIIYT
jgi:hypothetical protein